MEYSVYSLPNSVLLQKFIQSSHEQGCVDYDCISEYLVRYPFYDPLFSKASANLLDYELYSDKLNSTNKITFGKYLKQTQLSGTSEGVNVHDQDSQMDFIIFTDYFLISIISKSLSEEILMSYNSVDWDDVEGSYQSEHNISYSDFYKNLNEWEKLLLEIPVDGYLLIFMS